MSAERSLRNRVAITLAVFSGAVSLALAAIVYLASHDLEERLIDDTLSAELDDYIARRHRNPHSLPERTATIRAFVVSADGGTSPVPDEVAGLTPGEHRLDLDGVPYRAAMRQVGDQRFVVLYDVSALKRRERGFVLLLVGSALLVTLVSALAGRWLSGRTIAPVSILAQRVAGLCPEQPPPRLADQFPWTEVRLLAADFDDYLARLHDFAERERLFTGDVSHELRTPMAVARGATELLLADPTIDGKNRVRAERIGRAVGQMHEIADALLALAREKGDGTVNPVRCDPAKVAAELVERYRELFRGKPVDLRLEVDSSRPVIADHAVLAMVLGNLLRNALSYTERGEVVIRVATDRVLVDDTGPGIAPDDDRLFQPYIRGSDSDGAGLGLSLVQRLCDRQGWRVALRNRTAGGTRAELLFTGEPTPTLTVL